MSLSDLKQRVSPAPDIGFSGIWHAIEWQPDLFKPQRFVVGILVQDSQQRRAVRLMESSNRIDCFFRPDPIAAEFRWLMSNARRTLASDGTLFGHNLCLSDGLLITGDSLETTADSLFDEMVSAAAPIMEGPRSEEVGPNTEEVRRIVSSELKRIFGLNYEQVAREQGQILSEHHLDVTLAPRNGAGSVISACYRTSNTIETKLLRAARDINAYASSIGNPSKAIFMQMPGADAPLNAKERAEIERLTGEESWKLERAGFIVPRHEDSLVLALEIREWAEPLL